MTDQSEPKEPTGEELVARFWRLRADLPLGALDVLREGRAYERALRERKRGERPDAKALWLSFAANGEDWGFPDYCIDAGVKWAESGDSDEMAALRAELAELEAVSDRAREAAAQALDELRDELAEKRADYADLAATHDATCDERDAEKARADRAHARLQLSHARETEYAAQANKRIAELELELNKRTLADYRAAVDRADKAEYALIDAKARIAELEGKASECDNARADRAEAKAEQFEADWRAAKIEFGDAMARARKELRASEIAHERTIEQRDKYHDAADELAYAIADVETIGEHTSANSPWSRALEALEAERSQLTQANKRIAELEKESENRQRHRLLAEMSAQGYAKELAEAREELRQRDEGSLREGQLWKDIEALAEKVRDRLGPDAHRAKPSPQSPSDDCAKCGGSGRVAWKCTRSGCDVEHSSICASCNGTPVDGPSVPPESPPPHETAPTLEKGVRYRVVENGLGALPLIDALVIADGTEENSGAGWRCISADPFGYHRVVRVESAPADDGPPLVGDTVRHRRLGECVVNMIPVTPSGNHDIWVTCSDGITRTAWARDLTVIRRAQPNRAGNIQRGVVLKNKKS